MSKNRDLVWLFSVLAASTAAFPMRMWRIGGARAHARGEITRKHFLKMKEELE